MSNEPIRPVVTIEWHSAHVTTRRGDNLSDAILSAVIGSCQGDGLESGQYLANALRDCLKFHVERKDLENIYEDRAIKLISAVEEFVK